MRIYVHWRFVHIEDQIWVIPTTFELIVELVDILEDRNTLIGWCLVSSLCCVSDVAVRNVKSTTKLLKEGERRLEMMQIEISGDFECLGSE